MNKCHYIEDVIRETRYPHIFVLIYAEILAILIRRNSDIKGNNVVDKDTNSILADDTSMLLDGGE